jgi:hypothetical protein
MFYARLLEGAAMAFSGANAHPSGTKSSAERSSGGL